MYRWIVVDIGFNGLNFIHILLCRIAKKINKKRVSKIFTSNTNSYISFYFAGKHWAKIKHWKIKNLSLGPALKIFYTTKWPWSLSFYQQSQVSSWICMEISQPSSAENILVIRYIVNLNVC